MTHWVILIDTTNFWKSAPHEIWGMASSNSLHIHFFNNVEEGDKLWFVSSKRAIAVATFENLIRRNTTDIVSGTLTDKMIGWTGNNNWTHEIRFKNMYDLRSTTINTGISGQAPVRRYTLEKFISGKYIIELESVYLGIISQK